MTDETPERVHEEEKTVASVVLGAWSEALNATGHVRVYLVMLVALLTILAAPFWVLLALLEKVGVYDIEAGWFA